MNIMLARKLAVLAYNCCKSFVHVYIYTYDDTVSYCQFKSANVFVLDDSGQSAKFSSYTVLCNVMYPGSKNIWNFSSQLRQLKKIDDIMQHNNDHKINIVSF